LKKGAKSGLNAPVELKEYGPSVYGYELILISVSLLDPDPREYVAPKEGQN